MLKRFILFGAALAFLLGAKWQPNYKARIKHAVTYGSGALGGLVTLFDAPLDTNGLTAADPSSSWPITGVAAADVAWWCDDADGSGGLSTHTFTAGGSITQVDSPFCPDGSHDDLTSGCLQACRFGAGAEYVSDDNNVAAPTGDFSYVIIARSLQAGGNDYLACMNEAGGSGEGWNIKAQGAQFTTNAENDGGTQNVCVYNTQDPTNGGWGMLGFVFDADANQSVYYNADEDNQEAHGLGAIAPSGVPLYIGNYCDGGTGFDFNGDILAFFYWDSALDDTDMVELIEYWAGINDSKGSPVSYTSTGPNCCWVDGAIECHGDNWPAMIGCELPPGATGAGSPSSHFYSGEALTNSAIYSRSIDEQTAVGTPTETDTSTDLFRDGRATVRVCDDDGAAVEGEGFDVDVTALNAADKIMVCVYAKDSAGTVLDLQVDESGVCGGSTINFAAKTIDTNWTQYSWEHSLADGACTTATYKISPTDWGTVASTTCAEWVVQVWLDQDWCPPLYCESDATAVGCGDDLTLYDISGVAGLADVADGTVVSIDFTPRAATSQGGYLFEIADSATATDYYRAYWHTDEKLYLVGRSAAEGSEKALYTSTSAWSPTAGTTYTLAFTINGSASTLSIDGTDEAGTNATLTNAPDSLDNLAVCALDAGTNQRNGWCGAVKVTK